MMNILILIVLSILTAGVGYSAYRLSAHQREIRRQLLQLKEQTDRIERHLELEHLMALSIRAREKGLISPEGNEESLRVLHEMEMDNWMGKK